MGSIQFAGGAVFDPAAAQLRVRGQPASLGGRALDVLCALAEKTGQLVTKRELIDRVWPDVVVEENNLQVQISSLRRLLGPAAILTVAGRGYRLMGQADGHAEEAFDAPRPPAAAAREPRAPAPAPAIPLLEREEALRELARAFDAALRGSGGVCLVYGEAGIGKSTLCSAFLAGITGARVLRGGCEALFSPRPLGPLHDFIGQLGPAAQRQLRQGSSRAELFVEVLEALRTETTVLLLEELHWADEATLDLIKYVGRRIHGAPVMMILTYRDDELHDQHPLRHVLGDLQRGVTRVALQPLSSSAVEELARQAGRPTDGILATTRGNPFFVTELLEAGGLPVAVRDAVLARVVRQSESVKSLLELISIVPGQVEDWLVEALVGAEGAAVEEALSCGLLESCGGIVKFRHELARQAVEQSIAPFQLRRLHGRVFQCLKAGAGREVPHARLVHHAKAAGLRQEVLLYAPLAARDASSRGAHREAAALLESALEVAADTAPDMRAVILEACAHEHQMFNSVEQAQSLYLQALEAWSGISRTVEVGRVMSRLATVNWYLGRGEESSRMAQAAFRQLEPYADTPEHAWSLAEVAAVHLRASRYREAIETGLRALESAQRLGDQNLISTLLGDVGLSWLWLGKEEQGFEMLERALSIGLRNRYEVSASRAYISLICWAIEHRQYDRAEQHFRESSNAFFVRHDLDPWQLYSTGWRARMHFEQGRWDLAEQNAARIQSRPQVSEAMRVPSTLVLARLNIARGRTEATTLLDQAAESARRSGELQSLVPAAVARCERHWVGGTAPGPCSSELQSLRALCRERHCQPYVDELGYWLWRHHAAPPDGVDPSSARGLQIAGRWREAAEAWNRLGCPLERAQSLLEGDPPARRQAAAILRELGAAAWLQRAQA
jgi:DNA-binding winged helix-turn-helix (wHTH) protein/tetratricopeptide (TPR) repeat protein